MSEKSALTTFQVSKHVIFFKRIPKNSLQVMIVHCLAGSSRPHIIHTIQHQEEIVRRKLAEQSSNLAASPAPANIKGPLVPVIEMPSSRSSGSFRAVPNTDGTHPTNLPSSPLHHESQDKSHPVGQSASDAKQPPAVKKPTNSQGPPAGKPESTWKYIFGICFGVFLLILAATLFLICRIRAARAIGPWKTGLSGQLQKAFVTGILIILCQKMSTANISSYKFAF